MFEVLPYAFLVLTLAALGAATVRTFLPSGPLFRQDKRQLEAVAWMFVGSAVLMLLLITMMTG